MDEPLRKIIASEWDKIIVSNIVRYVVVVVVVVAVAVVVAKGVYNF